MGTLGNRLGVSHLGDPRGPAQWCQRWTELGVPQKLPPPDCEAPTLRGPGWGWPQSPDWPLLLRQAGLTPPFLLQRRGHRGSGAWAPPDGQSRSRRRVSVRSGATGRGVLLPGPHRDWDSGGSWDGSTSVSVWPPGGPASCCSRWRRDSEGKSRSSQRITRERRPPALGCSRLRRPLSPSRFPEFSPVPPLPPV